MKLYIANTPILSNIYVIVARQESWEREGITSGVDWSLYILNKEFDKP